MISIFSTVLAALPTLDPGADVFGWMLSMAKWCVEQFQAKNFLPAVSGTILVLVMLARKLFLGKLDPKHLPLVSACIGTVAAILSGLMGLALHAPMKDVLGMLVAGLMSGAAASGLFDALKSSVLPLIAKIPVLGAAAKMLLDMLSAKTAPTPVPDPLLEPVSPTAPLDPPPGS